MPIEMVFLNIVQALETFHARFFYNNDKKKYIQSVHDRFSDWVSYDKVCRLLLSDTQMDPNCSYILLISRLRDLFIGQDGTMFIEFWNDESYTQTIADTRHYFTHYDKVKEKKALSGDDLLDSIFVLKTLLEYHICLKLGIDIKEKVNLELKRYEDCKKVNELQK